MSWLDSGDGWARLLLQHGLAVIYALAFGAALHQNRPLLGDAGILPIRRYLEGRTFGECPTIFHYYYSDRFYQATCTLGLLVSLLAVSGWLQSGPLWLSVGGWLLLWVLYLSIVNVGQRFYGFGWESMLVEAGFFAAFLGPTSMQPGWVPLWALRWMLLRVELGAGLIKLRHDRCWRDLTCLYYHYETQPIPNPLSWYFHRLPRWLHRAGVVGSHFAQVVVPFALLWPQPWARGAALILAGHQFWLIVSGNYVWLNWLTVVLAASALGGPATTGAPRPWWFELVLLALAALTLKLSREPVLNLLSKNQLMNHSYNPFRLVNTYGAFGSVTRQRYEIILQGTDDPFPDRQSTWREYEFWAKPGDPRRMPPQIAPYHLRLDWLIWFLPFSIAGLEQRASSERRLAWRYDRWFIHFLDGLLKGDRDLLRLLRHNPFPDQPPLFVRALIYHYRYSTPGERAETGAWWVRRQVGVYLPAYCLTPGESRAQRS